VSAFSAISPSRVAGARHFEFLNKEGTAPVVSGDSQLKSNSVR
jgi:hypothetical protein